MASGKDSLIVISSDEDEVLLQPVKRARQSTEPTEVSPVLICGSSSDSHDSEGEEKFEPVTLRKIESPVKERRLLANNETQLFLHGIPTLPIYCETSKALATVQCMDILLDPELTTDRVCGRVPFDVNCNSVYIVDLSKLTHPKDIVCDDMGVWRWKGSYRKWLSVDEDGSVSVIGKTLDEAPSPSQYRIWKRYYENKSSKDLKRMIVTLEDSEVKTQNLALIQYTFQFEEHEVKIAPHGNSMKHDGFVRTKPSVMAKLKGASSTMTAKRALSFVSKEVGGIENADSASTLPRNRQQVKDMRCKSTATDALFSVMMMCKESESARAPDAFVRIVTGAPYPMMVLAFDWTLNDLVRFCTLPSPVSILGIDPTFNLGSFDVTVYLSAPATDS